MGTPPCPAVPNKNVCMCFVHWLIAFLVQSLVIYNLIIEDLKEIYFVLTS